MTCRHQRQPRTRKFAAASRRSFGKAEAPAMTLNAMYHCVPNTIRNESQMSGFSRKRRIDRPYRSNGCNRNDRPNRRNWANGSNGPNRPYRPKRTILSIG